MTDNPRPRRKLADVLESDEPMALVTQGGGMRGTYGIAALVPFCHAGYERRFGDLYGTSAGAMNGAYYLSGQSEVGLRIYIDHLTTGRFIRKPRLRRIIDIDYLVDVVLKQKVPLDVPALVANPTRLHVGATSASTGDLEWFDESQDWDVFEVLRASAALPIVFGREIPIGSDRYVDGGLNVPVPIERAISDGYRNILVVLTRPLTYEAQAPSRGLVSAMRLGARIQRHSHGVRARLGSQGGHINRSLELIREGVDGQSDLDIWCISPSGPIVGRLTSDPNELEATADVGQRDGRAALEAG